MIARLRLAASVGGALLRSLRADGLRVRAMALTYISLFAIVPALVVAFSVIEAVTGMEAVSRAAHGFLLDNLAVGARAAIAPHLDRFVRNAHATGAGVVGGALLLASAASLLGHVERALNEIWAVRRPRPLAQRALLSWAGLTLAPVLLAASLALGHQVSALIAASPAARLLVRTASVLVSCLLFSALYLFVPATRVRPLAAAAGGLVAGLSWELAKSLYGLAVARFFHWHSVYGSVAAVPIFLAWLYLSWTLALFGARVSFVVQHARVLIAGHAPAGQGTIGRELLAARAMLEVALAFRSGGPPPDPGQVALRLRTYGEPVREVLDKLRARQLVHEVSGAGLVPARPLDQITLADVRRAISGQAAVIPGDSGEALVADLLSEAESAAADRLAETTFAELCHRSSAGPEVAGAAAPAPATT